MEVVLGIDMVMFTGGIQAVKLRNALGGGMTAGKPIVLSTAIAKGRILFSTGLFSTPNTAVVKWPPNLSQRMGL